MKKTLFIMSLGLFFILTGCQNNKIIIDESSLQPNIDENQTTQLANPASTNCLTQGGKLEIRDSENGQYGVCLFEDNRQCEEWALFRGNCPVGGVKITGYDSEAQIFCAITGGQVEGVGTNTPMCKRIDGTLCNAQANFLGQCPDPNDPNPNAGNAEESYTSDSWQTIIADSCTYFFDGCNNCSRNDKGIIGCTKKFCQTYSQPKCLD